MKVRELIALLQAMPQDAEVVRMDWFCGGETHYDYRDTSDINRVVAPPSEHHKTAVIID